MELNTLQINPTLYNLGSHEPRRMNDTKMHITYLSNEPPNA